MILVANNHPFLRFPIRDTFRTVQSVLQYKSVSSCEVSIVFVESRFIRGINRRFLRHDYITDVIAFPLGEGDGNGREGEIYVNLDRAKSQARDYGITFVQETRRLIIHGMLHLLGYMDSSPRKKARMTRCEDALLAQLSASTR